MVNYTVREPLGFWGTVGAVALGILLASAVASALALAFVGHVINNPVPLDLGDVPQVERLQRPQVARRQPRPQARNVRPLAEGERCIDGVRYKREGSNWTAQRDGCRNL